MTPGAGFVRVSTGSQDEASQIKVINGYAADNGVTIVKWFKLHGYSASAGAQEPAIREAIEDMTRGDYAVLLVTESSRLDRREDLDVQIDVLRDIRFAGGDVISISEPQYGKTDLAGRIITQVAQYANAEKSKTVKSQTYRGVALIRDNRAWHGALPAFWESTGLRYNKQAVCVNQAAVSDIYERVAKNESLLAIARDHDLWPQGVRNLVRWSANHTGVAELSYTYKGVTETWAHKVEPVVESSLWWRANKVLDENLTNQRKNKGGRKPKGAPVGERPEGWEYSWISGVFDCPECGGRIYLNAGKNRHGNLRPPKLRCGGQAKQRVTCGRFKGCDAKPVMEEIDSLFSTDDTPILSFQRIAGNGHELDALKADVARIQGTLSATEDDNELDKLIAERKAVKAQIESFVIVPDSYDYTETGQTVSGMWKQSDDVVKRQMTRAVKNAMGLDLSPDEDDTPRIYIGALSAEMVNDGIVDLGGGLCFRYKGDEPRSVEPLVFSYPV